MKYEIVKLDGRFTHRDLFEYCIKFPGTMARGSGPLHFNQALRWFFETYGWSAEVRQYENMLKWVGQSHLLIRHLPSGKGATGILEDRPDVCNPHWSWTNGYDDLRIYVQSAAELNFFQLRWPNEQ